ncbi:hypothetical protein QFC21_004689 [Naganishia friedmannii]|uniref:Uncharacterized protein n=1 Tax=Naganishia friedmannii TaxID=89922 RepID=A0ACC2VF27_9TREE|nr:hypothetical protein QFC21_004689 [Naganishia friedmannii]
MQQQVTATSETLIQKAKAIPDGHRLLVGITGRPGGGKTTFCTALLSEINRRVPGQVAFVPMDGFHYTRAQLDKLPDPADAHYRRGAVDTFDAQAWFHLVRRLRDLASDETISVPGFDHAVKDPEEDKIRITGDKKIILLEGNYLLLRKEPWVDAANLFDERILVDTPREETIERLARRNYAAGICPTYKDTLARVLAVDVKNGDLIMSGSLEPTIRITTTYDSRYAQETESGQIKDPVAEQVPVNDA